MPRPPRASHSYALLVRAILGQTTLGELAALRRLAREVYAGDDRLAELEAMIDDRASEIIDAPTSYDAPELRPLEEPGDDS